MDRFGIDLKDNGLTNMFTFVIILLFKRVLFPLFEPHLSNHVIILTGFVCLILSRIFSLMSVNMYALSSSLKALVSRGCSLSFLSRSWGRSLWTSSSFPYI